jgi:hypothetical protein
MILKLLQSPNGHARVRHSDPLNARPDRHGQKLVWSLLEKENDSPLAHGRPLAVSIGSRKACLDPIPRVLRDCSRGPKSLTCEMARGAVGAAIRREGDDDENLALS